MFFSGMKTKVGYAPKVLTVANTHCLAPSLDVIDDTHNTKTARNNIVAVF